MILISRSLFIFIMIFLLFGVGGLGYYGYEVLQRETGAAHEAEWYFYWHLVFIVCVAVFSGGALFRSANLSRELDKLILLSRKQGYTPGAGMRKLGKMGEKITLLYFELSSLNEKKTLKIGTQRDLIEFLLGIIETPLVVADVTGTVLYSSRGFGDREGGGKAGPEGEKVSDIFPDLPFAVLMMDLGKRHTAERFIGDGERYSIYPVYNRFAGLSYIIIALEKIAGHAAVPQRDIETSEQPLGIQNRLRRLLGRRVR